MPDKIVKSDAQWKAELPEDSFCILRQHATEAAFSGGHLDNHAAGTYQCRGCGNPLFGSQTKFDSGSGWPSYYRPLSDGAVAYTKDVSHGMARIEVHCAACDGHLGHVFDDGPPPTHKRYCINSASLTFVPEAAP